MARTELTDSLGTGQELVSLLLNSTGEGIYGTDLNGNCIFANPACLQLLGFESDDDVLGRHMHDLVHHTRPSGEAYPVEECRIYRAFREHEGTHVEDEVMWCADGSSFPAEYWSYPVERDGELIGCVVTFTDISERLKVQERLRQQEELVRSLLDSTGEGIYGTDMDGNCTFANPSCLKLLGYERDSDLLGKNMHALVHHTRPSGEAYPVEECRIYRAFRDHKGTHVEDEVMWSSDGSSFPAEYWSYPVESGGELVGCVVTFVDIGDRLKLEEELRQTEKMAALGKLSAGLAHELNNPAAAAGRASSQLLDALGELREATVELTRAGVDHELWGSLVEWDRVLQRGQDEAEELSAMDASDREDELSDWLDSHDVEDGWELAPTLVKSSVQTDDLEKIAATVPASALNNAFWWLCRSLTTQDLATAVVTSSQSISKLVDAAKSFSFMDQDQVQMVDIHRGLEDTVTMLGDRISRIDVAREYDDELPRIQAPGSELNQVWMNLIDNAVDAAGEGGKIILRTSHDDGQITVEIEDAGPGVPEEIRGRIFDPFFTTKEVGAGTGLGLDVVRRIVTMRCGGSVELSGGPGATVFRVRLPIE